MMDRSGPETERAEGEATRRTSPRDRRVGPTGGGAADVASLAELAVGALATRGRPPLPRPQLLDALLATVPLGVAVVDREQRVVLANDAFARAAGASTGPMVGRPLPALFGRRARAVRRDLTRVLEEGEARLERRVCGTLPDGAEERHGRMSYQPLHDEHGVVEGALVILADITARVRAAAERDRMGAAHGFLADAGRLLARSLDCETTLREVARLLVPRFADFCTVHLRQRSGGYRQVAAAHADPACQPLLDAAGRAFEWQEGSGDGEQLARTLGDAGARRLEGAPEELIARWLPGAAARRLYAPLTPHALVVAPLVAHESTLGFLTAAVSRPSRRFDEVDRWLVEELAARAALAIDNATLHERERHARAQAEAASHAKSAFLAMMSHEIRTPINAIMGYGELLQLGLAGPLTAEQRRQLDRIRGSSRHLLALVNDVLDLAKVEAGRLSISREQGAAADAVHAALALVQPQAEARDLLLANRCADTPGVRYMGDAQRVEQILVNLLSNAVRFTAPGGRVTVRCEVADAPTSAERVAVGTPCICAIHVEDTGIGIAPDHLDEIFEPFTQVDSGHTRTREGTGLGLAISRRLARLMGGDLTVTSTLGAGSAFTLWLPGVPTVTAHDGFECVIAERRTPSVRAAQGLREIGQALQRDLDTIVASYLRRLRNDPALSVATLSDAQLLDHTVTFVADVALALAIVEDSEGAPTQLMRDGTEIQRVIADRHGRLRHTLGFDRAALERDFAHLGDALEAAVERAAPAVEGAEQAQTLVRALLERARETSIATLRRAGEE